MIQRKLYWSSSGDDLEVDVNQRRNQVVGAHPMYMQNIALLRALRCEQRASESFDPAIKREWEALAIEWHQLANTVAKATSRAPQAKMA